MPSARDADVRASLVPRPRNSHKGPQPADANFGFKGGTSKNISRWCPSEVRFSVPQMLTNFGIGTLVARVADQRFALAPEQDQNRRDDAEDDPARQIEAAL